MSNPEPSPTIPSETHLPSELSKQDRATAIQDQLATLTGPTIDTFLDRRDLIFAAVIMVTSDGITRHTIHQRLALPTMTPEDLITLESEHVTGVLHGAISAGHLHATLTEHTAHSLRTAIRLPKP